MRRVRTAFYPFTLVNLDDKGSCLIPLCASEYTEIDNPCEGTGCRQSNLQEGVGRVQSVVKQKRNVMRRLKARRRGTPLGCSVQTQPHTFQAAAVGYWLPGGTAPQTSLCALGAPQGPQSRAPLTPHPPLLRTNDTQRESRALPQARENLGRKVGSRKGGKDVSGEVSVVLNWNRLGKKGRARWL